MDDSKASGLRDWRVGMIVTFAETRNVVEELIAVESWPLEA